MPSDNKNSQAVILQWEKFESELTEANMQGCINTQLVLYTTLVNIVKSKIGALNLLRGLQLSVLFEGHFAKIIYT